MGTILETYQRAHAAFNERDWTGVTATLTSDITYTDNARGVTVTGPQQFVQYLQDNWVAAFSDAQVAQASYLVGANHVICQFIGTGTNDGPLGSFTPTGKSLQAPLCEIMQFDGAGRIASGALYYDQMTILTQLGHFVAPTAAA